MSFVRNCRLCRCHKLFTFITTESIISNLSQKSFGTGDVTVNKSEWLRFQIEVKK